MKSIYASLAVILLIGGISASRAEDSAPGSSRRLISPADPFNRALTSRAEYLKRHPVTGETVFRRLETPYPSRSGHRDPMVYVVVNSTIYDNLNDRLTRYQGDLLNEGLASELYLWESGTVEALRALLQSGYSNGVVGALLVGDIPFAWTDYMWGYDVCYPIDLFLSDMNGTWTDSNGDGVYDDMNSAAPEIWVGRLYTENLTWDDPIFLLQEYFDRNHAYRTGTIELPYKGLSFIDDGWGPTAHLEEIFPVTDNINSTQETNAYNYKQKLHQGYSWVHVLGHSSPWGNTFLYNNSNDHGEGTVFNMEIAAEPVETYFITTNGCSNARWIEMDNMANWYIFGESKALFAFGSTKLMYEMDLQSAYQEIGEGEVVGEGMRHWWGQSWNYEWHSGMVMLGDPSLHVMEPGKRGSRNEPMPETDFSEQCLLSNLYCNGHVSLRTWGADVWMVFDTSEACRASTYYIRSQGCIFGSPVNVYYHYYWDWYPAIQPTGDDSALILWSTSRHDHNQSIEWATYTNDSISGHGSLTSYEDYAMHPSLAILASGDMMAVWQIEKNACFSIESRRRNGQSWDAAATLSSDGINCFYPRLALDDDGQTVAVAWNRFDDLGVHACFRIFQGVWGDIIEIPSDERLYLPTPVFDAEGSLWIFVRQRVEDAVKIMGYKREGTEFACYETPCSDRSSFVCAFNNPTGNVELVWREKNQLGYILKHACWNGTQFSPAENVTSAVTCYSAPSARYGNDDLLHVGYAALNDGYWNIYEASKPFEAPVTATPEPTPSPTAEPTGNPTVVLTCTPANTASPVFTEAPTAAPTSAPSQAPTNTPVFTPNDSPTPTVITTYTPVVDRTVPLLELNREAYAGGDPFLLACTCMNAGEPASVDHYIILDVYGSYWFWPDWSTEISCRPIILNCGARPKENILNFVWPENAGTGENIFFWSGFVLPASAEVYGEIDSVGFDYY